MVSTVQFNDQSCFWAIEIGDERANTILPIELVVVQSESCTLEDEPERGYEIETKTSLKG